MLQPLAKRQWPPGTPSPSNCSELSSEQSKINQITRNGCVACWPSHGHFALRTPNLSFQTVKSPEVADASVATSCDKDRLLVRERDSIWPLSSQICGTDKHTVMCGKHRMEHLACLCPWRSPCLTTSHRDYSDHAPWHPAWPRTAGSWTAAV